MGDNTIRLFFALWPDSAARSQLVEIGREFSALPGRFNHADDLHMTLVFLGPVAEERMECILAAAERVPLQNFSLSLDLVASWRKPNILWCGPSLTSPSLLTQLVADLKKELLECGFTPEKRCYKPHVTLVRKAPPVNTRMLSRPVHWPIDGFVLAASGGKGVGPRYRILKKWAADS